MMLCQQIDKSELQRYNSWIRELKLDGDRAIYLKGELINRRYITITKKYPQVKIFNNCICDGELVFFTDRLKTDFNLGRRKENWTKCCYVIFDVLEYEGLNLKNKPLRERREYLKLIKGENIKTILEFENISWEDVVGNNYEGLILKNPNSIYENTRSWAWVKCKNVKERTDRIKDIIITENGSRIALIENNGNPQKVRIDGHNLNVGDTIKVKYLDTTENGKLRQGVIGK